MAALRQQIQHYFFRLMGQQESVISGVATPIVFTDADSTAPQTTTDLSIGIKATPACHASRYGCPR